MIILYISIEQCFGPSLIGEKRVVKFENISTLDCPAISPVAIFGGSVIFAPLMN